MEVVQFVNKETIMDVLETFCICEKTHNSHQFNDKSTISYNRILETTVKHKNINMPVNDKPPLIPPLPTIFSSGSAVKTPSM